MNFDIAEQFQGDLYFPMSVGDYFADIMITKDKRDAVQDTGIETSVIITWFTDKRAKKDDILPSNSDDKRGWLGSEILNAQFPAVDFELGSYLWLYLERSKITPELIVDIENELVDSLSWMKDFNIADEITARVLRVPNNPEALTFECSIKRPGDDVISFRYMYNWESQLINKVQ